MNSLNIEWMAPEFEQRPKGIHWYWASILIAVMILGFAVWQNNFLFGFFVVVAEILVITWANREPQMMNFSITSGGVGINKEKLYPYSEMESFGIDENTEADWFDLQLHFHKRFRPDVKLRVARDRAGVVKEALGSYVSQIEYKTSFLDAIENYLRF